MPTPGLEIPLALDEPDVLDGGEVVDGLGATERTPKLVVRGYSPVPAFLKSSHSQFDGSPEKKLQSGQFPDRNCRPLEGRFVPAAVIAADRF